MRVPPVTATTGPQRRSVRGCFALAFLDLREGRQKRRPGLEVRDGDHFLVRRCCGTVMVSGSGGPRPCTPVLLRGLVHLSSSASVSSQPTFLSHSARPDLLYREQTAPGVAPRARLPHALCRPHPGHSGPHLSMCLTQTHQHLLTSQPPC